MGQDMMYRHLDRLQKQVDEQAKRIDAIEKQLQPQPTVPELIATSRRENKLWDEQETPIKIACDLSKATQAEVDQALRSMKRFGEWMQTASNKAFWPLDPRPEEVDLEDIAHSLAHQCRYAGHCKTFYSVAEHSVRVARYLEHRAVTGADRDLWELVFAGLLHDAAEAYVVDLPRPVKRSMKEYGPIEDRVSKAIWEKFAVGVPCDDKRIKNADEVLLATEKRDLMGPPPRDWELSASPIPYETIVPTTIDAARKSFLSHFYRYNDLRGSGSRFG